MKARTDLHARIRKFRGCLKSQPGEKSITQELLEDRAWEKAHDEKKYRRWEVRLRDRGRMKPGKGIDS